MSAKEIFKSFVQAFDRFEEILKKRETVITRDAAIKRFEFTYELAWKSLQKFLSDEGIIARSPKGCFREAFKIGLIQDSPLWLKMIKDRNLTVHTYNETTAKAIYKRLKNYLSLFKEVKESLKKSTKIQTEN